MAARNDTRGVFLPKNSGIVHQRESDGNLMGKYIHHGNMMGIFDGNITDIHPEFLMRIYENRQHDEYDAKIIGSYDGNRCIMGR